MEEEETSLLDKDWLSLGQQAVKRKLRTCSEYLLDMCVILGASHVGLALMTTL